MIVKFINLLCEKFLQQYSSISLQLVYPTPALSTLHNLNGGLKLEDIFDGFLLATPKSRTPVRKIWRRKYGDDNWKYGSKLFKSKRNIVTCMECGNFHEIHTICRACFQKTQEISRDAIEIKENTLWFDANLIQPTANTKKTITGSPSAEPKDNTIKIKE